MVREIDYLVGCTHLLTSYCRYCEGKFVSRYISTIGVDFGVRSVEVDSEESNGSSKTSIKNLVKVNFWDLSGHPEFYEVRNEFYKDTNGVGFILPTVQIFTVKLWILRIV